MTFKSLKYFSTLLICVVAIFAGWWLWNYYMQSPWTRDGKVRAEVVTITPEVSGRLITIPVRDNQFVRAGSLLFALDPEPFRIALDNARATLANADAGLAKATHELARRQGLKGVISAETLDEARLAVKSMQAQYQQAQAAVAQAQWNLSKTRLVAPTDGYITNLQARQGNYASAGTPLVALVDAHSFYVMGYFEETKLRHIREGDRARLVLYDGDVPLSGRVEGIGRAISDQSLDSSGTLLMEVKPNVPWVRLAQRVPVRIALEQVPAGVRLVAGTTCTISIGE